MNSQYAIGIHGYILVYSITSKNSFNMIQVVYDKIVNFSGVTKIPCVMVGSKCDLSISYVVSFLFFILLKRKRVLSFSFLGVFAFNLFLPF